MKRLNISLFALTLVLSAVAQNSMADANCAFKNGTAFNSPSQVQVTTRIAALLGQTTQTPASSRSSKAVR